ncbi:MAG: DUF1439 domain-containing protein [Akkermansiaceae bacterium]|nr:DUF1439 domain-containing protein [Akkermansiaceae bacterium]
MKLAIGLIIGLIFGGALVIGGYFFLKSRELGDDSVKIIFTEEEIQNKIGENFPKTEHILNYFPIVIQEPKVKFLGDSNRVQLSAQASVTIPFLRSENVEGVFTASVRYENKDKTLRISDLTVESLSTESLPEQYEAAVRLVLTVSARKYLDDSIVHTLKPKDYKGKLAEMFVQKIHVEKERLEVILGL